MKHTALITGASSGLGLEFAKIHASRKGDLVIVARRQDRLAALKKELETDYGVMVKVIAKDLSDPDAAEAIYKEVTSEGIVVDYLINNAGFGGQGIFHERDWSEDLAMIQVNIIALTALTRLFLPDFVSRNKGRILNVSSTASLVPGPLQAVYYATKSYVTSFSNALAGELEGTEVTVTNLMPGAVATEFGKVSGMDKTYLFANSVNPHQVAAEGYKGMIKGKLDVISGMPGMIKPLLRLSTILPKRPIMKMIRRGQTPVED